MVLKNKQFVRVALCQIRIFQGLFDDNFKTGLNALGKSVQQNAQIAILPELWTSGYDLENAEKYADKNLKVLKQLSEFCRTNKIWCVAGSFILKRKKNELANTCIVFDQKGTQVASYEKMHLFPSLNEHKVFFRGILPVDFNTPWGKAGLALCYDIRFPEIFRCYFRKNVKMIFIPAQFPFGRIDHWKILLKARALEDNCFIIACNAASNTDKKTAFGFSAIMNPWGEEVVQLGHDDAVVTVKLDLNGIIEAEKNLYLRKSIHPFFINS